jgi:hypothetical protein
VKRHCFREIETGTGMINLISGLLSVFALLLALAGLPVGGAVVGVLALAWCTVFEQRFNR